MPSARDHVKTIFGQAAEIESAADRSRFLDQACSSDPALRAEVENLLAAANQAGDFLAARHSLDQTIDSQSAQRPGAVIGPYKLLQQIGEGGMGVVYMAEQSHPVQRRVALKIIKPGMDTRQVIARFEAERQALALMDHPNIARVLDAGTTGSQKDEGGRMKAETEENHSSFIPHPSSFSAGRPFFVMELVKGVPITKYCDEKHLNLRERLELMIPVCQAIQHAHQKGIIHRDIKPSNVLIAQYDGRPVPKVIDFGVAKATAQKLTERTMFTELGQVVGTIEYMSPEQAELNQLDIDTRSDIYSLGVLLYELLTGSTPFDKQKLRTAAFHEMLRIIREDEPPKPSTRLSTIETLPSVAASRSIEPARLSQSIRGELDWIVMKSLDKDRARRYETASGLAADIQRYLNDEPVQACPPTTAYRIGKLARKHRAALTTAALLAVALVLGAAASTWQAIRATRAEAQARANETKAVANETKALAEGQKALAAAAAERDAKQEETAQRQRAEENERKSNEAAAEAKAVLVFLQGTVMLARPKGMPNAMGKDVTLRQAVERAARDVGSVLKDQPGSVAAVREALGVTYRDLGESRKAIEQHQLAYDYLLARYGGDDPHTLDCLRNLAMDLTHAHRHAEAVRLLEQGLALAKARFGPNDDRVFPFMHELGIAYRDVSRVNESIRLLEAVLDHEKAKPDSEEAQFAVVHALSQAYVSVATINQAVAIFKEGYELGKRFPADDYRSVEATKMLGMAYFWSKETDKAAPILEEVLEKQRAILGSDHPHTIDTITHLADAYTFPNDRRARPARLPLREEVYRWYRANSGDFDAHTFDKAHWLLATYEQEKKSAQAVSMLQDALPAHIARFPKEDRQLMIAIAKLGDECQANGRMETALALYRGAYKLSFLKLGINHFAIRPHVSALAGALKNAGKPDEAAMVVRYLLPPIEAEFESNKAKLGLTDKQTIQSLVALVTALNSAQEHANAEPMCRVLIEAQSAGRAADDPETLRAKAWLGEALLGQRKYAEAEQVLRECIAGSQRREPEVWWTFKRRSLLGMVLLGQARDARDADSADAESKFAAAEQELIAGYEGLKARYDRGGHWWLANATKRLVDLYTAWEKPDAAAKWQAELDALNRDQPK